MNVSYGVTGTLRAQMGGHPPLVIEGCCEPDCIENEDEDEENL